MASFNPDGSIQTSDGRTIFADDPVTVGEFAEISKLLVPQKAGGWPFAHGGGGAGGFVASGGGGGGGAVTPVGNGAQGAQGAQGNDGAQGAQGPGLGAQGAQGPIGPQGTAGAQGSQGATGSGAQGAQGAVGPQGTAGAQGSQGTIGAQGAQGSGVQGAQGSSGAQGSQGTAGAQGSQGPQAPLSNDIFAATRVVDPGGAGTDTTIASALAALPAAGGDIYIKGGTYPIAATLDFTTKVVRIRGAGTSVDFNTGPVTLVPGPNVTVFASGAKGCSVEDITIEGDQVSSQILYSGSGEIRFSRIDCHNVAGIIFGEPEALFRDSYVNVPAGPPLASQFLWKGTTVGGMLIFDNVELFITSTGATIMDSPLVGAIRGPTFKVVNSYVGGGGGGGSTNFWNCTLVEWTQFTIDQAQFEVFAGANYIVNCDFLDFSIKFHGIWNHVSNSKFSQGGVGGGFFDSQITFTSDVTFAGLPVESIVTGCTFFANFVSNFGIKVQNVNPVAIANCIFENHLLAGVTLTAGTSPNPSKASVTGCRFTETTPLTEGDANAVGRYTGNFGFSNSTIAGPDTVINEVRRKDVTAGATVDALTAVFTHTNDKGLIGAGSIKNTGANSLTVRRTGTDGYAVTDFQEDVVLAGATFTWPMDTALGTALPAFSIFTVSVKSTTPGSPTTYNLHHSSAGAY